MSRLLLVRSGPGTWGIPEDAVRRIVRAPDGLRIRLDDGEIGVAEVIGRTVAPVRRPGPVARRLLPASIGGLAVGDRGAFPIIDPSNPPEALTVGTARTAEKGGEG